ncbi:MAG: carboxymuconolactone decarboxylase family protein [Planctomycetota bacterium]
MAAEQASGGADRYDAFHAFRERLNTRLLGNEQQRGNGPDGAARAAPSLGIKRFFALDTRCYEDGALDAKTKEGLGLVASAVLRCDDCIAYHIDRCVELGWTDDELMEVFEVALIVGGSIVIPHLRRGVDFLDACRDKRADDARGRA